MDQQAALVYQAVVTSQSPQANVQQRREAVAFLEQVRGGCEPVQPCLAVCWRRTRCYCC